MTGIARDFEFACRLAVRRPLLTLTSALTLALGVGANTTIVSAIRTVLLNPLGMRDTEPVMVARVRLDKLNMPDAAASGVEYREVREMTDVFGPVAAAEGRTWTSQLGGESHRLLGQAVTNEYFAVFAEVPAQGRFLSPEDREAVVLSHGLWRTQFGADPGAVGRTLRLDGKPHRIVGVARETMKFPVQAQLWIPLELSSKRLQQRGMNMNLTVLARRRPGVSEEQAVQRVKRYVSQLLGRDTAEAKELAGLGYGIGLRPFGRFVAGDLRQPLLLLGVASLVLVLAGCANIGLILLARTGARAKEIAVRSALGASTGNILRQLLIESFLLALLGGAAGLGLASFGKKAITGLALPGAESLKLVNLDLSVMVSAICLSLLSGVLFGLAPALQLARATQTAALARHRKHQFQNIFVVVQVASALVLVFSCGLLIRSLHAVQSLSPGFDTQQLHTAYLLKPAADPTFLARLRPALAAQPGVESAALAYPLPFSGGGLTSSFRIRNRQRGPNEPEWHGEAYMVSPEYFRTLRVPLLQGRGIEESDTNPAPLVCVIDAQLAQKFFPGQDPLGQEIAMYRGWARIVGIAGAIRGTSLEEGSRPAVYYSLDQVPFFQEAGIVVRARQANLREAVKATNASVALYDMRSMEQRLDSTLGLRKSVTWLLSVFGAICLLLASVGLYGVVAQVAGERTREIGIRLALGARPGQVLRGFLGQAAGLTAWGLGVGLLLAAYAARWVRSLLYGGKEIDPALLLAAGGVVAILALASAWWPAYRASRVDPQQALRVD